MKTVKKDDSVPDCNFNAYGLLRTNEKRVLRKDSRNMGGFLIDSENGEKMSPMTMEFTEDGQVIYTIDPGTGMQNEFSVNYWTNNGYLYTENSDSGEEEKAKYQIYENKLTVITGKVISEFIKQ